MRQSQLIFPPLHMARYRTLSTEVTSQGELLNLDALEACVFQVPLCRAARA